MQPAEQFDAVRDAARSAAPDHYLSALLAPRHARDDLIVLTAFLGETARIPHLVTEPALGEIRLQWWRDALASGGAGRRSGHPVADALIEMIGRRRLSIDDFKSVLDVRSAEIEAGPSFRDVDLAKYFAGAEGTAFRLAAQVIGLPEGVATRPLLVAAGEAYGLARLLAVTRAEAGANELFGRQLLDLHAHAQAKFAETRQLARDAPHGSIAAILPVALVGPYLRVFEGIGHHQERRLPTLSPLTRVTRLWLAHITGRV